MARHLSIALAASLLALLAAGPTADAAGLDDQRVVAKPAPGGKLIAPLTACPAQVDLDAPLWAQERSMVCMAEYARRAAGLGSLAEATALDRSAADKTLDILRCDDFSHFACGREFTYWMGESGYTAVPCWRVGENLAWGVGELGTVRSIFLALMRSPTHRKNLLGDYGELGVGVAVGNLAGRAGVRVWTQHFGLQCAGEPAQP